MHYDIFNGDADGIIALLQLRLAFPIKSTLITGIKRDIKLVKQVNAEPRDTLTILDVSMEKNKQALLSVLNQGVSAVYIDHHRAGDIPQSEALEAHIDLDANTCTALIVDKLLAGRYHNWAITAAYGDNLVDRANQLADEAGLSEQQKQQLKELGTLINYNGYGADIEELHYHPAELFKKLKQYPCPFDVIADPNSPYHVLKKSYQQDLQQAFVNNDSETADTGSQPEPDYQSSCLRLYKLKPGLASRRVSGVFGNALVYQKPDSAHAVLTQVPDSDAYVVSIRAPLNNKQGAGEVCSRFETGGGREAAGGINFLAEESVEALINAIEQRWGN